MMTAPRVGVALQKICQTAPRSYNIVRADDLVEDRIFHNVQNTGGDFEVAVGDKIRMELCSNPTTGFQWGYEMTIENVLEEENHEFEEPKADVPGTAGIEIWTFEAVEAGETEVRMEYSQPWEGGLKSEWAYTVTVMVE